MLRTSYKQIGSRSSVQASGGLIGRPACPCKSAVTAVKAQDRAPSLTSVERQAILRSVSASLHRPAMSSEGPLSATRQGMTWRHGQRRSTCNGVITRLSDILQDVTSVSIEASRPSSPECLSDAMGPPYSSSRGVCASRHSVVQSWGRHAMGVDRLARD